MVPPHNTRRYIEEKKKLYHSSVQVFVSRTRQANAWRAFKFSDGPVQRREFLVIGQ